MALFGRSKKSKAPVTKPAGTANIDDIWSAPVKRNSDSVNTKVVIKESTSLTPDTFNGPRGINPKVLERSMEELERELKERDEREPEVFEIDGISTRDMSRAEEKFEQTVLDIREKQSRVEYGVIASAEVSDIDRKVKELEEQYDYLTHGTGDVDYGFETISKEEFDRRMDEFDALKAEKRQEIIWKMPGLTETQKQKIQEFFEQDIVAAPLDFVNSIPELSQRDLERIRKKLDEIYVLENEKPVDIKIESI